MATHSDPGQEHVFFRIPLDLLRGFGAIIEGAEFLLTHRTLWRPLAPHFGAGAALALGASLAIHPLQRIVMAHVPPLVLPWYLAPLEWAWGATPGLLASLLMLVLAEIAYLAVAWPAPVIQAVALIRHAHRSDLDPSSITAIASGRWRMLLAMAGCTIGCVALLWTSAVGSTLVATFGMVVISGAGLLYPAWQSARRVSAFGVDFTRVPLCIGLGGGLFVLWMIPLLGVVSLPIGVVGTACLALREGRGRPARR